MTKRCDVLVVGGGVIGVCAAYYLAGEGRQVTLLDRDEVCSGSSYGNSGLIVPSHSLPLPAPGVVGQALKWMLNPESPFYVKLRPSRDLVSWLWQFRANCTADKMIRGVEVLVNLSTASINLYEDMIATERLECGFTRNGIFMLYDTQKGFEMGQHEAEMLEEFGLTSKIMTGPETHIMEPSVRSGIVGSAYYAGDGHLDPARFVNGLADVLLNKGVTIREGVEVLEVVMSDGRVGNVTTSEGDYHPDQLVLAAGSWSPSLARRLPFKLPVQPVKGYSVMYAKPSVIPTRPLILSEARVGVNPMGDSVRLAGTLEMVGFDLSLNQRRVAAIVRGAKRYFTDDGSVGSVESVEGHWAGLRPCTPDGLPIVGHVDGVSNLIVATGHAMLGMTLGPVTGKLVAEMAAGAPTSIDVSALSSTRFQ